MKPTTKKNLCGFLLLGVISISSVSCADDDKEVSNAMAVDTMSQDTTTQDVITNDPMTHGEEAHENHCYKCHTDEVYTRDNRFVKSIDALSKQVVRCKDGNDVPWFDEDTDAVVQFLNKKYYKF